MRNARVVAGCFFLYLAFLLWRFPYQAAVDHAVRRFESASGARVEYRPHTASLFGVQLQDVKVHWPSGVEIRFASAQVYPGFSGVRTRLVQPQGSGEARLDRSGRLEVKLDRIQVESGSQEFGSVRATGDLFYNVVRRDGGGDLRVEIPRFRASLPIPEMALDIGTKLTVTYKGIGHEIRAEVHAVGGQEFAADGPVVIEPQPGALPPRLSGTLQFKAPGLPRGTIRLEGTWKKPQITNVASGG